MILSATGWIVSPEAVAGQRPNNLHGAASRVLPYHTPRKMQGKGPHLVRFLPASSVRDLLKVPFRDPKSGGLFVTEPTRGSSSVTLNNQVL